MHDHFGHFGIGKSYSLTKRYYYWPKVIKHTQAMLTAALYVEEKRCKLIKTNFRQLRYLKERAKVSIDLTVEMPTSHYENKNILVMVDHLTSWPVVKVIPDKEATTVANVIFEKLILEHRSPEILLSDNGKEFTNDTLVYICQEFGIEQNFTSPYTPRSNGKTENFNKFLKG